MPANNKTENKIGKKRSAHGINGAGFGLNQYDSLRYGGRFIFINNQFTIISKPICIFVDRSSLLHYFSTSLLLLPAPSNAEIASPAIKARLLSV